MPEITPSRYRVDCGMADVPHISAEARREILSTTLPHLRVAREKGTPSMGAGAIYPIEWEQVICSPFAIPDYWPRWYALDVGWRATAAMWFAWDRDAGNVYGYAEHKREHATPVIHADAIKRRGAWMRGVIDPAARGRQPEDGRRLITTYTGLGLDLTLARNAVDAGLLEVLIGLESGTLKLFSTLTQTEREYRRYRRDVHGKIIKTFDHLMDCLRYGVMRQDDIPTIKALRVPSAATSTHHVADKHAGY